MSKITGVSADKQGLHLLIALEPREAVLPEELTGLPTEPSLEGWVSLEDPKYAVLFDPPTKRIRELKLPSNTSQAFPYPYLFIFITSLKETEDWTWLDNLKEDVYKAMFVRTPLYIGGFQKEDWLTVAKETVRITLATESR